MYSIAVNCKGTVRRRLMDMGLTPGAEVMVLRIAPMGDPLELRVRGYELSLRRKEARCISVIAYE